MIVLSLAFTIASGQNEVVNKKESEETKKQEAYWYADQPLKKEPEKKPKAGFSIPPIFGFITELLMWGIVAVAVVTMLYFIIRNLSFNWNTTVDNTTEISHEVNDEKKLRELDYSKLISQAVGQADYRLAIRWYYLWVLKELSAKDKIVYDKYKTNNEYKEKLREVLGSKNRYLPIFNSCVKYYEYIWFGQFPVSEEQFCKIEITFKEGLSEL